MGLFAVGPSARAYFAAAAAAAAHELGLFASLAAPQTIEGLAASLGVAPRRLRALADVLALDGALVRSGPAEAPTFARGRVPAPSAQPRQGWGRLAEVIRRDRPLDADAEMERFHAHLAEAGAAAARALAERLATLPAASAGLLDLGGGAGAYTAAFLARLPTAPATLVDRAPVVALARASLDARAHLCAGDLFDEAIPLGHDHGIALYANVLHLYGGDACARLCARAARAVASDGWVVVKDLHIEVDRAGPAEALLFALNMALYTDDGDVHDAARIASWLAAAGLCDVRCERLGDDVVVLGRRPGP